jgi:deoxyribonuclease IV
MPKIGAHVSAAVSLDRSFDKAQEIGAECTQIFISPPRQWTQTIHGDEEVAKFIKRQSETQITPNFVHGTYLINLGSQSTEHLEKSINWLSWALNTSSKLKVSGVIFHMGSHKGLGFENVKNQVIESLKKILKKSPKDTDLILENPVITGGNLGSNLSELGELLKGVNAQNLKVCMDTQHAFASGYDLKSAIGLKDFLEEFDLKIGIKNLAAIHLNDSKTEYKSFRDRHENIGEGLLGAEGISNIINHKALENVPFILEVPGFSGNGPDKENIAFTKSLLRQAVGN